MTTKETDKLLKSFCSAASIGVSHANWGMGGYNLEDYKIEDGKIILQFNHDFYLDTTTILTLIATVEEKPRIDEEYTD